eukprot:snap_masked-scaffold_2-processed-gene-16.8-mRNA-1 protein AED:1.00 eAED:1.00 QI:0/0/0/0/1/1/2/0/84
MQTLIRSVLAQNDDKTFQEWKEKVYNYNKAFSMSSNQGSLPSIFSRFDKGKGMISNLYSILEKVKKDIKSESGKTLLKVYLNIY